MAKGDENRVALLLFGVVVIVAVVGLVFMFTGSSSAVVTESGDDAALAGNAKYMVAKEVAVQANTNKFLVKQLTQFSSRYDGYSELTNSQVTQVENILDSLIEQNIIIRVRSDDQLQDIGEILDQVNDVEDLVGGLVESACWTCTSKHVTGSMTMNYCYHAC